MRKYLQLLKISWSSGLVYRTSLLLWRFRQMILALMSLTVWSVLFTNQQSIFGYSSAQMISYIFLVSILQSLILATSLNGLAGEIYSGDITPHLLRPENLFYSFATVEIADKLRNFFFTIGESLILFILLKPEIVFPSLINFIFFLILLFSGILINFFISILFGTIGFWSPDIWGPKFLFFMIVDFTAGKLFPLDIFPIAVQKIIYLTPFPYLSFIQTQVFLGNSSVIQSGQKIFISIIWIALLAMATRFLWRRGMKEYSASGL